MTQIGDELTVEVAAPAMGGHCVGYQQGPAGATTVFVRHSIPGETVRARITKVSKRGRLLFADAVAVIKAVPARVEAPCTFAHAGGCGGCDWQHMEYGAQLELKSQLMNEQLRRLANITEEVQVQAVAPPLQWRTRVRYKADEQGRLGFRQASSHDVVPVTECLIGVPGVQQAQHNGAPVLAGQWPTAAEVEVVAPSASAPVVFAVGKHKANESVVKESCQDTEFDVPVAGFWQVHPLAAKTLSAYVTKHTLSSDPTTVWDLYSGVGLFGGMLRQAGYQGRLVAVESNRSAVQACRRNVAKVQAVTKDVGSWLRSQNHRADVAIVDPPRAGLGKQVLTDLLTKVDRVVYVSCDAATFARDLGTALAAGWSVAHISAWDLFPMTQHWESAAVLQRR